MTNIDFKEWNNAFRKLKYRHDTWYIFRDFLDMTIDNFTIPDQTPLFEHGEKYTEEEYSYFGELFSAYIKGMQTELEKRPYCDFLGEWWEADQDMTNKFNAQFFTPLGVCDVMCQLTLDESMGSESRVMYDCCCGSGRFGLAHHYYRPQDYFFFNDLDQYAVKMTVLNMLVHGMRGVVAHMNTLTEEVFWCCQVTPFLYEYGGMPYVVPYGTDIGGALSMLPQGSSVVEAPSVNTIDNDKQDDNNKNKGVLDEWF